MSPRMRCGRTRRGNIVARYLLTELPATSRDAGSVDAASAPALEIAAPGGHNLGTIDLGFSGAKLVSCCRHDESEASKCQ